MQITLPRDPHNPPADVVRDCFHHSNIVYEEDCAQARQFVTMTRDDHSLRFSYRDDSRSPSLSSRELNIPYSQNSSARGTPASSAPSTPKMLRSPWIHRVEIRKAPKESTLSELTSERDFERTASHTPESSRPTNHSLLRRTKSASLSLEDLRFSADFSVSSYETSCEPPSSEAATPTMKQSLGVPLGKYRHYENLKKN